MVRFAVRSALGLVAYGSEEAHRGAGSAAYLLPQEGEYKSKRGESNEGCVLSLEYSSTCSLELANTTLRRRQQYLLKFSRGCDGILLTTAVPCGGPQHNNPF